MKWQFSKNLVYSELVFKLFAEVTLEPLQKMRGRQMGGLQAWCPVPNTALLCVLCIGFFYVENLFLRETHLLQNLNAAEIFRSSNTNF